MELFTACSTTLILAQAASKFHVQRGIAHSPPTRLWVSVALVRTLLLWTTIILKRPSENMASLPFGSMMEIWPSPPTTTRTSNRFRRPRNTGTSTTTALSNSRQCTGRALDDQRRTAIPDAFECTLYYCVQTFNSNMSLGTLNERVFTSWPTWSTSPSLLNGDLHASSRNTTIRPAGSSYYTL